MGEISTVGQFFLKAGRFKTHFNSCGVKRNHNFLHRLNTTIYQIELKEQNVKEHNET